MSTKLNAEELAAKRFPAFDGEPHPLVQRGYYAEAIREVAQPIADERDELVELVRLMDEHEGAEGWSAGMHERISAILAKYPRTNDAK